MFYSYLYQVYPENTAWLFYLLSPLILGFSLVFALCSHYLYIEKIKFRHDDDDQECLLDDDSNSESFSEYDPNANPLD
jgi:hypothetical protein